MEIKPYEKNAKEHPKEQVELIARSIQRFGWRQPIVVNQDGTIVVGHGRWEAYNQYKDELNLKEAWIIDDEGKTLQGEAETTALTPDEERSYRLADNQINALSGNNMTLVKEELKMLDEELLELTGFDKDLIIETDDKDDMAPGLPQEAQSKVGDVYELGRHRLVCGDSTDPETVARLMNGRKADMVFTDPPYGVDYEGIKNDDREGLTDLLRSVFTNYLANSKSGASIYCFHSDRCADIFNPLFREFFHFSSMIIWVKNSLTLSQTDYQSQHEPCLYGWMDNGTHSFYGDRKQTSIWKSDKERVAGHTTPKPIEIVTKAVANSSKGDDIVLDLFLGSGSTLIASQKTGRICYGMELDEKYIDVIIERWCQFTGIRNIKKNGQDYYWEAKQ